MLKIRNNKLIMISPAHVFDDVLT